MFLRWAVTIVKSRTRIFPTGKEGPGLVGRVWRSWSAKHAARPGILRREDRRHQIGSLTNDLSRFVAEGDRMVISRVIGMAQSLLILVTGSMQVRGGLRRLAPG